VVSIEAIDQFCIVDQNQDEKNKYYILVADTGCYNCGNIIADYQGADLNFGTGGH